MDPAVIVFAAISTVALLVVPRRWAPLPLIAGACYMTRGQAIEIGVASFTVVRLLIVVGIIRLVIRREWIVGGVRSLDWLMMAWGTWMVASVVFHTVPTSPFVLRVRDVYEAWGLYLLFRAFCTTREEIEHLALMLALVLIPISAAMAYEKVTGINLFARFGGVAAFSAVRNGVVRAQGPFAHAILAGSIGGVCVPLMATLWRSHQKLCVGGTSACLIIVMASGSSGPILAAGAGLSGLALWRVRNHLRLLRWMAVLSYIALDLAMKRPAYFVITYIDLVGGSTSWHRAQLIRTTFDHFDEWWLIGTDYTRHWMASGVPADPRHTDITNHYIAMGIVGGLPLMLLFITLFVKGFSQVGRAMQLSGANRAPFLCWTVGASLFAHAVTCLSVSYFDHSILFLYLTLAATTAVLSSTVAVRDAKPALVSPQRHVWRSVSRAAVWTPSSSAPTPWQPAVARERLSSKRTPRTNAN